MNLSNIFCRELYSSFHPNLNNKVITFLFKPRQVLYSVCGVWRNGFLILCFEGDKMVQWRAFSNMYKNHLKLHMYIYFKYVHTH